MSEQPFSPLFTIINGRDILSDPGLAALSRYVPILAVVAAPYAGLGGDQDPLNPLDRVREWRLLTQSIAEATQIQAGNGMPLALVRLMPPTSARLKIALTRNFPIVHFACYGERDMLYLEDDTGHEAYAVSEHLVNLFVPSKTRLVMLDGGFSKRLAQMLIDQTQVEVVIGSRRRAADDRTAAFNSRFYAGVASGISPLQAFRIAVSETGLADRYELVDRDDLADGTLLMASDRAERPLLTDSQPRSVNLPHHAGFIGQREILDDLAEAEIPALALLGRAGIGKSWLAAEFAGRFGWRYRDGIVWFDVNPQTDVREIKTLITNVLETPDIPAQTAMLLVLDQIENLAMDQGPAMIELIAQLGATSRVMLVGRRMPDALVRLDNCHVYAVEPFNIKSARTLALRLAVERQIEALDVDTIDEFIERTLYLPWLIARGADLIESDGIDYTLRDLAAFRPDTSDPLGLYISQRLKLLALEPDGPIRFLMRVQILPDAFDPSLAAALGGTPPVIESLIKQNLVERRGDLLIVPTAVRAQLTTPLDTDQRQQADRIIMQLLVQSWREETAWLNNTRAMLEHVSSDPAGAARLIATAAPLFRSAGLLVDFINAALMIREKLTEGPDLARLQIALGNALYEIPGRENEAGWLLEMSIKLAGPYPEIFVEAVQAHSWYLHRVGEHQAAGQLIASALQALTKLPQQPVLLASKLAHTRAKMFMETGEPDRAAQRLEMALTGYTRMQRLDLAVEAQRDFGEALVCTGEIDKAEDILRRGLTASPPRELAGDLHRWLARAYMRHAEQRDDSRDEWIESARHWHAALENCLPTANRVTLAELYGDLGRVQTKFAALDDAESNLDRCQRWYEQAGKIPEQAAALVTLGQIRMARGDSVSALEILHHALELAPDPALKMQAAGVLLRVHEIRGKLARRGDESFRQQVVEKAIVTRGTLSDAGLEDYAAALDNLIHSMGS
jgi:tetratricopeptide (TPR) repeat protein